MDINKFKDRLKSARKLRKLNQTELSIACINKQGEIATREYISGLEGGKYKPSYDNFLRIAEKLDCSLDYLAGFSDIIGEIGEHIEKSSKYTEMLYSIPIETRHELIGRIKEAHYQYVSNPLDSDNKKDRE